MKRTEYVINIKEVKDLIPLLDCFTECGDNFYRRDSESIEKQYGYLGNYKTFQYRANQWARGGEAGIRKGTLISMEEYIKLFGNPELEFEL